MIGEARDLDRKAQDICSHALSYNLGSLTGGARCSLEFGCGSGLFSFHDPCGRRGVG
jgi:hypothetical protein